MRLHPSVGLTMPRISPVEGLCIADTFIPGGYKIGINPAVVQYNASIFGDDSLQFRPERWLQEDASTMERSLLTFGAGTRTCIGKNVRNHIRNLGRKEKKQADFSIDFANGDPQNCGTDTSPFRYGVGR